MAPLRTVVIKKNNYNEPSRAGKRLQLQVRNFRQKTMKYLESSNPHEHKVARFQISAAGTPSERTSLWNTLLANDSGRIIVSFLLENFGTEITKHLNLETLKDHRS